MENRGRPTLYTEELASEICERMASGESVLHISRDEHMPAESTIRNWALTDRDGFFARYTRAQILRAHHLADESLDISDDGRNDTYRDENGNTRIDFDVIQRSRLRVDTRKWYLSKVLPKVYGERQAVEHSGPNGGPIEHTEIALTDDERTARVAALLEQARARRAGSDTDGSEGSDIP